MDSSINRLKITNLRGSFRGQVNAQGVLSPMNGVSTLNCGYWGESSRLGGSLDDESYINFIL